MLSKYQINRKVGIKIKMISIREVTVKYNSLGVPDSMYKGVIRQTDNYVTRLIIDLTDVPGDISNVGLNVKKGDGTTNTDGLIICHPIVGQVKHFYVDISNWFTNIPGTLEINVQALASMNGLTQVFNCSKIEFAIEGTAIELDPTVVPEFFNVLSVNGQTGIIEITHENIGDGAEIVKQDEENANKFYHRTIKAGNYIIIHQYENHIEVAVDGEVVTDDELTVALNSLSDTLTELLNAHKNDASAHGVNTLATLITALETTLTNHANNTDAHALGQVKDTITALENVIAELEEILDSTTQNNIIDLGMFIGGMGLNTNVGQRVDEIADTLVNGHNTNEEAHSELFSAIRSRLESIENIIGTIDGEEDANDVIDKLHEIVNLLNGYAEGTSLAELLSQYADVNHNHDETYVQQEEDKGLSSNDFTTAEKNKLSGIESGAKVDLYWCTRGTTTYEEITQALNAGKLPVLMYMDNLFIFNKGAIGTGVYRFASSASVDTSIIKVLYITPDNTWSILTGIDLQLAKYMVQEIGETHTEYDYPSVNAVKTYVDGALGDLPDVDLSNYYNKSETENIINNAILGLLGGEA